MSPHPRLLSFFERHFTPYKLEVSYVACLDTTCREKTDTYIHGYLSRRLLEHMNEVASFPLSLSACGRVKLVKPRSHIYTQVLPLLFARHKWRSRRKT